MSNNQNPVFTDGSLSGDGTFDHPLSIGTDQKFSGNFASVDTNTHVMDGTEQEILELDTDAPGKFVSFSLFLSGCIQFGNTETDADDLILRIRTGADITGTIITELTQSVTADQPNASMAIIGTDENNSQASPSTRKYFLTAQRSTGEVTFGNLISTMSQNA